MGAPPAWRPRSGSREWLPENRDAYIILELVEDLELARPVRVAN
jgi:hypothetical protein